MARSVRAASDRNQSGLLEGATQSAGAKDKGRTAVAVRPLLKVEGRFSELAFAKARQ
jgi:hypothetical protein